MPSPISKYWRINISKKEEKRRVKGGTKKLVPSKWDIPFQNAKESLKKGNINKAAERLDMVDFGVWVNRKSLLYLEKNKHYFEKSPSLDKYKSDVGNSILDGSAREKFLKEQV